MKAQLRPAKKAQRLCSKVGFAGDRGRIKKSKLFEMMLTRSGQAEQSTQPARVTGASSWNAVEK